MINPEIQLPSEIIRKWQGIVDLLAEIMHVPPALVMSNVALADGVAPDRTRIRPDFPYFGPAFTAEEQAGIMPAQKRSSVQERRP